MTARSDTERLPTSSSDAALAVPAAAIPAALSSWGVMMAVGLACGMLFELQAGRLNSANVAEYVTAFIIAMPLPFALIVAAVFLPTTLGVRALARDMPSPSLLAGACVLAAPVGGLLLIALGSAIWGPPSGNLSGCVTGATAFGQCASLLPVLAALIAGGITFGVVSGRRHAN